MDRERERGEEESGETGTRPESRARGWDAWPPAIREGDEGTPYCPWQTRVKNDLEGRGRRDVWEVIISYYSSWRHNWRNISKRDRVYRSIWKPIFIKQHFCNEAVNPVKISGEYGILTLCLFRTWLRALNTSTFRTNSSGNDRFSNYVIFPICFCYMLLFFLVNFLIYFVILFAYLNAIILVEWAILINLLIYDHRTHFFPRQ